MFDFNFVLIVSFFFFYIYYFQAIFNSFGSRFLYISIFDLVSMSFLFSSLFALWVMYYHSTCVLYVTYDFFYQALSCTFLHSMQSFQDCQFLLLLTLLRKMYLCEGLVLCLLHGQHFVFICCSRVLFVCVFCVFFRS